MASGPGVNQGKTTFLEEYLRSHPDANAAEAVEAWTTAGNEGTISESLVGKIRAKMGLTNRRVGGPGPAAEADEPARRGRPKGRGKVGRPRGRVGRPRASAEDPAASSTASAGGSVGRLDDDTLDSLEETIDELIEKIRALDGPPDAVKALRRARRHLVRSHEG